MTHKKFTLTALIAVSSLTAACSSSSDEKEKKSIPFCAGTIACSSADVSGDPCEGVSTEAPPAPGVGSLTIGDDDHELIRSTLGEGAGLSLLFYLGDSDATITVQLNDDEEPVSPVVYVDEDGTSHDIELTTANFEGQSLELAGEFESDPFEAEIPVGAILNGTTMISVDGTEATITGDLGRLAYQQISNLRDSNPEVTTLILQEVPGSVDDEANLQTLRLVREAGYHTRVPSDGLVASGGSDLLFSGATRSVGSGAQVGIHSWATTDGVEGADLGCDNSQHDMFICTYHTLFGEESAADLYFYTLAAAPAAGIHYMSEEELECFQIEVESNE